MAPREKVRKRVAKRKRVRARDFLEGDLRWR